MTAVYVVIAFFAGAMAALSFSVFVNKKYSENDNGSSDKQDILTAIESLNRISEKMSGDFDEITPNFRDNYENLEKIRKFTEQYNKLFEKATEYLTMYRNTESELNKLKDFLRNNRQFLNEAKQQANTAETPLNQTKQPVIVKPDETQNIFAKNESEQPSADNTTEIPVQTEQKAPVLTEQKAPVRTVFKMSDVFEIVEKLRAGNASYRVYNPSQNNFEYSNDVNSKFILYNCGDDIFVLPNQSSPFARKQVAEKVYKCSTAFIDYEHSIIPCIADESGNITEQGEIF
ncbi:MAG: hypothetical protein IJM19_00250 [Ruminococcus sp.]|nr:hypothetical protein [Ruminococcus sp.]